MLPQYANAIRMRANVANSLAAVSDESGHIRLLDTSSSQETAITTEHIRMTCHDNAIFDISWSSDDMKLVFLRFYPN